MAESDDGWTIVQRKKPKQSAKRQAATQEHTKQQAESQPRPSRHRRRTLKQPQQPAVPGAATTSTKQPKPSLLNLPEELKDMIYDFVYSDCTLLLRKRMRTFVRNPYFYYDKELIDMCPVEGSNVLQPTWYLPGNVGDCAAEHTNSLPLHGILLTCKQTYRDALPHMYSKMRFQFETFALNRAFLRGTPRRNLLLVRKITVQHVTAGSRPDAGDTGGGHAKMWRGLVRGLPNVEDLNINFDPGAHPDGVVLRLDDPPPPEDLSVDKLESVGWLQPLKPFTKLRNLKHVKVSLIVDDTDGYTFGIWTGMKFYKVADYPGPGEDEANQTYCRWVCFYRTLHETMGRAIEKVLLKESEPWGEHVDVLEKMRVWIGDRRKVTGLFDMPGGKEVEFYGGRYLV